MGQACTMSKARIAWDQLPSLAVAVYSEKSAAPFKFLQIEKASKVTYEATQLSMRASAKVTRWTSIE